MSNCQVTEEATEAKRVYRSEVSTYQAKHSELQWRRLQGKYPLLLPSLLLPLQSLVQMDPSSQATLKSHQRRTGPAHRFIHIKTQRKGFPIKWSYKKSSLSSGWSLIRVVSPLGDLFSRSFIRVVSPLGGLSSGWFFIRVVSPLGGLSSGWSLLWVVSHQCFFISVGSPQGGLMRVVSHQSGLSSGWSLIKVVFHQGGLSSKWSFIMVVFYQGGLSSKWSFIRVVFRQGGLS